MELKDRVFLDDIFERIRLTLNKQQRQITKLFRIIAVLILLQMATTGYIIFMAVHKPDIKAQIEDYFDDTTNLAEVEAFEDLNED